MRKWKEEKLLISTEKSKQEEGVCIDRHENECSQSILLFILQEGRWKVRRCEDRSFYICKKAGEFSNASAELQSDCPEVSSFVVWCHFVFCLGALLTEAYRKPLNVAMGHVDVNRYLILGFHVKDIHMFLG